MGFRFQLVSSDGEILETFETAQAHWGPATSSSARRATLPRRFGDPGERLSEFVDEPIGGVLEVEPL